MQYSGNIDTVPEPVCRFSESFSTMPEILQKKQGYNASLKPNVPFIEEAGIPERLDTLQASHLEAALPPLMTRISPGSLT